jgi:UMF1 family MFS transporter
MVKKSTEANKGTKNKKDRQSSEARKDTQAREAKKDTQSSEARKNMESMKDTLAKEAMKGTQASEARKKPAALSWCLYDWANSAFATTIMAAVLPVYYGTVAGATLSANRASSYWGYTNTVAMLIIASLSPILGAMGDAAGKRKSYLFRFALLGVLSTGLLICIGRGDWLWASFLYILGRIGFGGGNVFYDSLLPFVAEKEDFDRISCLGYALGYLGGGLLLTLNLAMILKPRWFGLANSQWGSRASFLTVSLWWAIFSLPVFLWVKEPQRSDIRQDRNPLFAGFRRLSATFHKIRQYREAWKFLLAYWLYNDGIGTIIIMATIFGAEIGIAQKHLIGAILLVQFLGIPFTLIFGWATRFLETKTCILLGLSVYTLAAIGGYFMRTPLHFWMLAVLVALVQGGCQALSRSFFGRMIPDGQSAEFFAFYDISAKFAGIIGPALFGFVGQISGSSRYGIVSLVIFFLLGGFLLTRVH